MRELGVSATLYGVLSRGLLTGSKPSGAADFRAHLPRFAGENSGKNEGAVEALRRFAQARGMTPAQLAIAWVLARQPRFVPVVGARTVAQLNDALGALEQRLSAADASAVESMIVVAGDRYQPAQMAHLDSERSDKH